MSGKSSAGLPETHRGDRPTLANRGIDKNLPSGAGRAAATTALAFSRTALAPVSGCESGNKKKGQGLHRSWQMALR